MVEEKLRKSRKRVRINPVQSRLGFLRENSQIYWVKELGGKVFGERRMQMGGKEQRGGKLYGAKGRKAHGESTSRRRRSWVVGYLANGGCIWVVRSKGEGSTWKEHQ
jgi:hypothetical protein